MSFGFSLGDFLAVIELVTRLRKDFANAPNQLRDLSAELKTFSIVLQDTEVDLTESELDPGQVQALESTLFSARVVLGDLQRFIEKHKEVSDATGSKARGSIKRIWKRLNFDQQEVSSFRLQLTSIVSGLHAFSATEVKHNTRKIARYVDTRVHKEVLEWLSSDDFNYHKNFQSHLVRNRQAGTRKWLFGSDEWTSWLKSTRETLYCPGIPGSGKTFTTAMVIENIGNLSEEQGWVFAYVFCNYQQRRENMHETLLRSLLRMILEQTQQIPEEVHRWPTRNKEIGIDEILAQLRISIQGCSRVCLVVDALDELDKHHTFVSYLLDLQKAVDVNLYVTSRDIPHIRALFDAAMIVPIKATEHDVSVYLDHQMTLSHVPNFVRRNQILQDEIKQTIVNAVGEMFLLADLQIKQLMQSKSTRRLQNALKAITSGTSTYDIAYEAAMERIQSQDKRICELAKDAISILAYAERPLLAPELVHALSVDFDLDDGSVPEPQTTESLHSMCHSLGVYDPDLVPTIEDVLAASAGLIVHQPDSGIVQLVHKTTKEYLMSDHGSHKWFPRAQFTIAAICLVYSQAFEDSPGIEDWPFLDYAQKHYGHHIIMAQQSLERIQESSSTKSQHEPTADQQASALQAQMLMDQMGFARMAQELGRMEDMLTLACQNNQLNLARVLLSTKQYSQSTVSTKISFKKSWRLKRACAIDRALMAAVENGHVELVDLLLRNGANPMIGDTDNNSLLARASKKGHDKLVAYLLDHDFFTMKMMHHDLDGFGTRSSVNKPFPPGGHEFKPRSPICMAAYHGNPECVKVLLKWLGIDNNENLRRVEQDRILENVTLGAMAGGHSDVLEVLPRLNERNMASMLRTLGDPNLLYTSMRWAQGYSHYQNAVAKFLLRTYTFDLSVCDARGDNTLALAAHACMPEIVRLILEASENLFNSQDKSGRTNNTDSTRLLSGDKDVTTKLAVSRALDSILEDLTPNRMRSIPFMVPYLEHGINTIVRDGCTLLHVLIEPNHWNMLEHYKDHNIFERRDLFSGNAHCQLPNESCFRGALKAVPVSADEVRSSPCKCGVGTVFLAISSEAWGIFLLLQELYPDLLNDKFFDGSSPWDLRDCVHDWRSRQSEG